MYRTYHTIPCESQTSLLHSPASPVLDIAYVLPQPRNVSGRRMMRRSLPEVLGKADQDGTGTGNMDK